MNNSDDQSQKTLSLFSSNQPANKKEVNIDPATKDLCLYRSVFMNVEKKHNKKYLLLIFSARAKTKSKSTAESIYCYWHTFLQAKSYLTGDIWPTTKKCFRSMFLVLTFFFQLQYFWLHRFCDFYLDFYVTVTQHWSTESSPIFFSGSTKLFLVFHDNWHDNWSYSLVQRSQINMTVCHNRVSQGKISLPVNIAMLN